ncbi:MAG: nucleotidyltransferase domain-containing protein [Clostridiales bacterium]
MNNNNFYNENMDDVITIYYRENYPDYKRLQHNIEQLFEKYKLHLENIDKEFVKIIFSKNVSIEEIELIRDKKKQLLEEVIKNMINWFPKLKNIPIMIFLFGSYGRNSNRRYSDIDLNFVYPDEYIEEILPIEEIICICLANLFELKGREKVHSYGCLPLIKNIKIKDITKFALVFNDGNIIKYKHTKYSNSVMNEILNMTRCIECLTDYLNSNNSLEKIIEWNSAISLIYNNTNFNFKEMLRKSDNCIKSSNFKHYIKILAINMGNTFNSNLNIDLKYTEKITVSEFKNVYKNGPHRDIYCLFSMLRLVLLYENYDIGYLRINNFLKDRQIKRIVGEKFLDELTKYYYDYYLFLSRIDYVFNTIGKELSSEIIEPVERKFYDEYKKSFDISFEEEAVSNAKNLYCILLKISISLSNYLS